MKRLTLLILIAAMSLPAFSISDKVKLGLFAAPGVSWMKPTGKDIDKGVTGFGMIYGLKVEYYFKDQNYAISTGLYGGLDGAGVKGRSYFKPLASGASVLERYNTNYVLLPAYLKLKTNPFKGKYILFGEVGGSFVFNVTARANYNAPVTDPNNPSEMVIVSKDNVLKSGSDASRLIPEFRYQIFDFRLSVGGGLEYVINDKTSVFFAMHYHNGFVNQIKDTSVNSKKDPIVVRNFLFSIGAMF
ncbi:MAG: hypothetical protein JWO03_332 [Bacteroidetes bacterium]|nr:hypothetical protein [Bacteroidota bacterium]